MSCPSSKCFRRVYVRNRFLGFTTMGGHRLREEANVGAALAAARINGAGASGAFLR